MSATLTIRLCGRESTNRSRSRAGCRQHRKNWEYAMLTLFFEDWGLLREDVEFLSVGAGHETALFWLANRVGKVVATDIYGEGAFGAQEADRTMLTDPASFSPYPFREQHLKVLHMDAKELEFPDDSFDAVFSLSSIEHFGSWADIRRSARRSAAFFDQEEPHSSRPSASSGAVWSRAVSRRQVAARLADACSGPCVSSRPRRSSPRLSSQWARARAAARYDALAWGRERDRTGQ